MYQVHSSVAIAEDEVTGPLHRDPHIIKRLLQGGITSDVGLRLLAPVRPRCASILFLHRFSIPELGIFGHDAALLSRHLEYLRKRRYSLISVLDLVRRIEEGRPLDANTLVFTIDDGYADFAEAGVEVFAAFDCPVTVFLVTDFVSGRLWNWFDRVSWAFDNSPRRSATLQIADVNLALRWSNHAERQRVSESVIERLKRVRNEVKEQVMARLAQALDVQIPDRAPDRYRGMTWDQVRSCGRKGATFGPHTVTHPILTQIDAHVSDAEISRSWQAVVAGTDAAVPVFCYPNGTTADFSVREKESVSRAGMTAALATTKGYLFSSAAGIKPADRFALPRIAYAEQKPSFIQIASGLDAASTRVRKHFR